MNTQYEHIKLVAFDLDGTIYHGNKIIDGAIETVDYCRKIGKRVVFLTNNSVKTRNKIQEKLFNLGVNCEVSDIYSSAFASAKYLSKFSDKSVYVYGTDDLKKELGQQSVRITESSNADILLIGFNPTFDYLDLVNATRIALKVPLMIACNVDRTFPGENGELFVGCGAMVGAVEFCAGRKCDQIIGKPNPQMLNLIQQTYHLDNSQILVVGDNYDSDIVMAQNGNVSSILISKTKHESVSTIHSISELINVI